MIDQMWAVIAAESSGRWPDFLALGAIVVLGLAFYRRFARHARQAREARSVLNLIVDSLQGGLVLQDASGQIISANPAAMRILGLSRDEITGRTSADPRWQAIHEDGSPWPGEDHPSMRTLRTGLPEDNVVMGLQRPDGTQVWLSISTARVVGEGVSVSFSDITERRNTALRERELEGRFRLLVDGVQDYAIYMLDVGGYVTSWNSGAERIKGYGAAEIIGKHFSCFYLPEDALNGKPARGLLIAADSGRHEEEGWRLRKDGSRFWAHILISPIRDESGQLLGYAKVSHDLSERRQAEQLLAESNRLRQAIFDSAPFSIIATDADGLISAVNPACERMLWYRSDELVGKATPALIHDEAEVKRRAAELSEEIGRPIAPGFDVFVHKSRFGVMEEREWSYVRKDGSRLPVNLAVTALRDNEGEISGYLGIAYDITERKRREEYGRYLSSHDPLTGLPNRSLMSDRLELALKQTRRSRKGVSVLVLDLDHFKRVNDSLGHLAGDKLLVTVAQRIQECVREADTVARLGGDEFVVLLPETNDELVVERIVRNIREAIAKPIHIGSQQLHITASIGMSSHPRDGNDMQTLLHRADMAMYRAKTSAGRQVRLVK